MINSEHSKEPKGLLFVVSGPSAVGKDTILNELLDSSSSEVTSIDLPVCRCVTATTRAPRPGEEECKDYHFLSVQQFHEMASSDGFLEYANVFGNWYGTPRAWVTKQRESGIDVILKIDVQGALYVKQRVDDAILVFFAPPSLDELERRLRSRATESEEQIARRLLDARNEMAQMTQYHYRVINNDISEAVADIRSILRSEHLRTANQA
jgi:guanylate kinase